MTECVHILIVQHRTKEIDRGDENREKDEEKERENVVESLRKYFVAYKCRT